MSEVTASICVMSAPQRSDLARQSMIPVSGGDRVRCGRGEPLSIPTTEDAA